MTEYFATDPSIVSDRCPLCNETIAEFHNDVGEDQACLAFPFKCENCGSEGEAWYEFDKVVVDDKARDTLDADVISCPVCGSAEACSIFLDAITQPGDTEVPVRFECGRCGADGEASYNFIGFGIDQQQG